MRKSKVLDETSSKRKNVNNLITFTKNLNDEKLLDINKNTKVSGGYGLIVESEELKNKFSKLEEIKTEMFSENDKSLFKIGFSMATKILIESLTCEI